MNRTVLIIGKIPPPAGGVGIHVLRLMQSLELDNINFQFHDLRKDKFLRIFSSIRKNDLTHIHVSNSFLRFILISIVVILNRKAIFTFHGNLGRYGKIKNLFDQFSFVISDMGIVINNLSFERVYCKTKRVLISAFIPPLNIVPLSPSTELKLDNFCANYKKVFCTNANGLSYDKDEKEIYGVISLVEIFYKHSNWGLVISDASGDYKRYFEDNKAELPGNIFLISNDHDFVNVIRKTDSFIRCTTTDGDSLSVKEALFYRKCTICSDCVDRPEGVILYKTYNWEDLEAKLEMIDTWTPGIVPKNGYVGIVDLFRSI